MNFEEFNSVVENRIRLIRETMVKKQGEYTRDGLAFHNFDKASLEFGHTPAEMLIGMWAKHYISLLDILRDLSKMKNGVLVLVDEDRDSGGESKFSDAFIEEKIGDLINYLIILEGILKERNGA